MPIGEQPHGAHGTVDHPYSALNLRLVLALFGFASCTVLGALAWWWGYRPFAVVLGVLAALALVDVVIVERRRHRRTPHEHTSLFE